MENNENPEKTVTKKCAHKRSKTWQYEEKFPLCFKFFKEVL